LVGTGRSAANVPYRTHISGLNGLQDSYGFTIEEDDSLEVQHKKVEETLDKYLGAEAAWQPDGSLHVVQRLPAVRRVKSTGDPTFFNGLAGTYGNARDHGALEPPHKNSNGVGYKLPTLYGDGSSIPHEHHEKLIELTDKIGFLVPWQEGDVALVNNYTVAVCIFTSLNSLPRIV
jgi:Taurine catabolism dioxygenase TauD, TfdA family